MKDHEAITPRTRIILEGLHAGAGGRPKDACPYPNGSDEKSAWNEGCDGKGTVRPRSISRQYHELKAL
jgi:ribosome modulation factor